MSESVAVRMKPGSKGGDLGRAKTTGVRILLVSDDIQIIDTLCHSMEQMAMHVDVCSDIGSATRKLCHSKFEALVVDVKDTARALELIKKPREMTSHKGVVVLAILNSSAEELNVGVQDGIARVVNDGAGDAPEGQQFDGDVGLVRAQRHMNRGGRGEPLFSG